MVVCNVEIIDNDPGIDILVNGEVFWSGNYCDVQIRRKKQSVAPSLGDSVTPLPPADHGITITAGDLLLVVDDVANCLVGTSAAADATSAITLHSFVREKCGAAPADDTPPPQVETNGLTVVCTSAGDPIFVFSIYDEVTETFVVKDTDDNVIDMSTVSVCPEIKIVTTQYCLNGQVWNSIVCLKSGAVVSTIILDPSNAVVLTIPAGAVVCGSEAKLVFEDFWTDDDISCAGGSGGSSALCFIISACSADPSDPVDQESCEKFRRRVYDDGSETWILVADGSVIASAPTGIKRCPKSVREYCGSPEVEGKIELLAVEVKYDVVESTGSAWTLFSKLIIGDLSAFPGVVQIGSLLSSATGNSTHPGGPDQGQGIDGWNVFAICAETQPADDSNNHYWIAGAPSTFAGSLTYDGVVAADPSGCSGATCTAIQEIKERQVDGTETYRFVIEDGSGLLIEHTPVGVVLNSCPDPELSRNVHQFQDTSGTGNIPTGFKTVVISRLTGTVTINGGYQLGGGSRPRSVVFNATNSDTIDGLLPAYELSGGTWQWIAHK